jgi:hypothetical protein
VGILAFLSPNRPRGEDDQFTRSTRRVPARPTPSCHPAQRCRDPNFDFSTRITDIGRSRSMSTCHAFTPSVRFLSSFLSLASLPYNTVSRHSSQAINGDPTAPPPRPAPSITLTALPILLVLTTHLSPPPLMIRVSIQFAWLTAPGHVYKPIRNASRVAIRISLSLSFVSRHCATFLSFTSDTLVLSFDPWTHCRATVPPRV